MDTIRIACFTNCEEELVCGRKLTDKELLMWTHYATAHQGICLEYEVPKEHFDYIEPTDNYDKDKKMIQNVSYVSSLAVDYNNIFNERIQEKQSYNKLLLDVFFLKDDAFRYENEVRILAYDFTYANHLSIEFNYLKKIVFGYRCIDATKHFIFCLNKKIYGSKLELRVINNKFEEVLYNE